jgi:hypothetical protein
MIRACQRAIVQHFRAATARERAQPPPSARFSLVYHGELSSQLPIWQRSAWVFHLGQVAQVEAGHKYNGEFGLC